MAGKSFNTESHLLIYLPHVQKLNLRYRACTNEGWVRFLGDLHIAVKCQQQTNAIPYGVNLVFVL